MGERNTQADDFLLRSPIYRALLEQGASFHALNNTVIAASYGKKDAAVGQLGLADLSPLPRVGFRGPRTLDWVGSQLLQVPERSGVAVAQNDGSLLARLTDGEVLILDSADGRTETCTKLSEAHAQEAPKGCYLAPRHASHAWFLVMGEQASQMFAKLCALDLRSGSFPIDSVAQTVVARVGSFIIRTSIGNFPAFHLLVDVSLAEYVWNCLLDAKTEFNGTLVGYDELIRICSRPQAQGGKMREENDN